MCRSSCVSGNSPGGGKQKCNGEHSLSTASLLHPAPPGPANEASGFKPPWARAPTKQSHKPSVDLATDDCDTSLRSCRVGASLNPEALSSATGLPPASELHPAVPGKGRNCNLCFTHLHLHVCVFVSVRERARGVEGSSLTNSKSKRMQRAGDSDHNTNSHQVNARMTFSCGGTESPGRHLSHI